MTLTSILSYVRRQPVNDENSILSTVICMVAIYMVTTICMVGFLAEQKTIQMTVTWKIKKSHGKNAFFSLLFLFVADLRLLFFTSQSGAAFRIDWIDSFWLSIFCTQFLLMVFLFPKFECRKFAKKCKCVKKWTSKFWSNVCRCNVWK